MPDSEALDLLESLDVSRETIEKLETYVDMLRRWNAKINLVSKSSLEQVWMRHIIDSAQVFHLGSERRHWGDLGSGGGFPGLVVAILRGNHGETTLVESDQRKAAFLRSAARECRARCKVVSQRIEVAEPLNADVLSARALADLETLLGFTQRHMNARGIGLFPKGASWQKEVERARRKWCFDLETRKSVTEPGAVILKVKDVSLV